MGSGILQLASYGRQDMLFVNKPTITYFKIVYKRHTNFASESIPQQFNVKPDFGQRTSCVISDIGDLLGKIYLNINLPPIGKFIDIANESGDGNSNIACCAWGEKIGYRIIKQIDFEVNNIVIEKHVHDWFNIYHELHLQLGQTDGINKMIGNVEDLTKLTSCKEGYLVSVPLIFWFNRYYNLAYPIIASYNSEVKINIEFNSLDECLILGPTHYVTIEEEICLFEREDIIYQTVNNIIHYFKFIYHDIQTKRLYYIKISNEELTSTNPIYSSVNISHYVTPILSEKLYFNRKKYFPQTINLALGETYLLVEYIFLANEEKKLFVKKKLEYVINILKYDNPKIIYHANSKMKINQSLPCTGLYFNCSYDYLKNGYLKDKYNYTNDVYKTDEIINSATLIMNGQNRLDKQNMDHFNMIEAYKYHDNVGSIGLGSYSFSIDPNNVQPAGYCNFAKIPNVEIKLNINKNVSYDRPIKFNIYAMVLNIISFENGLAELLF